MADIPEHLLKRAAERRAALEERRDLVYQAALLDPSTAATLSIDEIVHVCDALIAAHGGLIPAGIRGG